MANGRDNKEKRIRARLLDEIRRRAEEAELKRLEKEEQKHAPKTPEPEPGQEGTSGKHVQGNGQASILRDRLTRALDQKRITDAEELLIALRILTPDDPELARFESRLDMLRRLAGTPLPRSSITTPVDRAAREDHLNALLETARELVRHDEYDAALKTLEVILAADPVFLPALRFRRQVEEAKYLAGHAKGNGKSKKKKDPEKTGDSLEGHPAGHDADAEMDGGRDENEDATHPAGGEPYREIEASPLPVEEKPGREARTRHPLRIPWKPLAYGAVALSMAVLAYVFVNSILPAVTDRYPSILILPPAIAQGTAQDSMLAQVLTEDLIADLGGYSRVHVYAASTSFSFRRTGSTAIECARQVGADHIVTSTLTPGAAGMHWSIRLTDTASGTPVWSDDYVTPAGGFARQRQDVAAELVRAVTREPSPVSVSDAPAVEMPQGEPLASYLRGRVMLQRHAPATDIIALLTPQAGAMEMHGPYQFLLARAWMRLAEEYPERMAEVKPDIKHFLQKTAEAGYRTPEVVRTEGEYALLDGDYARAQFSLGDAVRLAPHDAESRRVFARVLVARGRVEQGGAEAEAAATVDPLNPESHALLGMIAHSRGAYESAARHYERALRLQPRRPEEVQLLLIDVLVNRNQPDRAYAMMMSIAGRRRNDPETQYRLAGVGQRIGRPRGEWMELLHRAQSMLEDTVARSADHARSLTLLALVHSRLGEFPRARSYADQAIALAPDEVDVLYNAARMYAIQREKRMAIDIVAKAVDRLFSLPRLLEMDFSTLRTEPEFHKAVTR